MPRFGAESLRQRRTLDPRLREVLDRAIEVVDFKILEGFRGEAAQNRAFEGGKSKLKWPNGKHNRWPSRAVDLAPWPIDWDDLEAFVFLAGIVKGIGAALGYKIRCGCDWDMDGKTRDERFRDYGHVEVLD